MRMTLVALLAVVAVAWLVAAGQEGGRTMSAVRLMTLDPGHFDAALIQKEMYPGVAPRVDVYAPEEWDLAEHLKRVDAFNRRTDRPTSWRMELHTGRDFPERMLRERPGTAVIMSGRNRPKIDRQHTGVVRAARRAHEVERDLGLGSAHRGR